MRLAVLIAARNEEWLNRTVADVLAHSSEQTEVIVVLDGTWPTEPIPQHPRVSVIFVPESIGQRAAVNLAARVTDAEFIMKLDAHCSVQQGFDLALIEAAAELGEHVIQIPAQRNLHVFNWVCGSCGRREYQCALPECRACGSKDLTREVVWKPRSGVLTKRWAFDADLRFQYWGTSDTAKFIDTMSCLGACWFCSKSYWEQIGGLDEAHGSWGNVGTELGCKAWLSGGRMVTNTATEYAHFFRVGGQGFPYPITGQQQEAARAYSRDLWRNNKWDGQKYSLKWIVDKFWPVPGWTEEQRDALDGDRGLSDRVVGIDGPAVIDRLHPRVGIVYYSDGQLNREIRDAVAERLEGMGRPIVSVCLGRRYSDNDNHYFHSKDAKNVLLPLERSYLSMFRQILIALELSDAEVIYFCEHDVLYSPSHFQCVPSDRSRVLYNTNVWKVSSEDGRALHYRCAQTSGLIGYRDVLLAHYRQRVALVEQRGFTRAMGFEPGTHRRPERVDDLESETCVSAVPNVDIRHGKNLTPSRWNKDEFRNQKYTEGWTVADAVPGWGVTKGRFWDFLREVSGVQQAVA